MLRNVNAISSRWKYETRSDEARTSSGVKEIWEGIFAMDGGPQSRP